MMNDLNIQFNNHLQNVKGLLPEALRTGYLADVTLVSDDLKHMSSHRLILAACSPVFRDILSEDVSQSNQILYLKGISSNYLKTLLSFVYNGEVNIDSLDAPTFLKILDEFQINVPSRGEENPETQNSDSKDKGANIPSDLFQEHNLERNETEHNNGFKEDTEKQKEKTDDKSFAKGVNIPNNLFQEHNLDRNAVEWNYGFKEDTEKQKAKIKQIHDSFDWLKNSVERSGLTSKKAVDHIDWETVNKPTPKIPCTICGVKVLHPERHLRLTHNQVLEKKPCPVCGKLVRNLIPHMMWKHNPDSKKFSCTECSYVSKCVTNVKLHMQIHSEERREFPCDKCESVLSSKSGRDLHIRRVHEKQKQTCPICQKQFISSLDKHFQTVHEGKRFPCEFCGHQSTQMSSLKMHIEAKHKGVKHNCEHCGKSFSQVGTLNLHIKAKHLSSSS